MIIWNQTTDHIRVSCAYTETHQIVKCSVAKLNLLGLLPLFTVGSKTLM